MPNISKNAKRLSLKPSKPTSVGMTRKTSSPREKGHLQQNEIRSSLFLAEIHGGFCNPTIEPSTNEGLLGLPHDIPAAARSKKSPGTRCTAEATTTRRNGTDRSKLPTFSGKEAIQGRHPPVELHTKMQCIKLQYLTLGCYMFNNQHSNSFAANVWCLLSDLLRDLKHV